MLPVLDSLLSKSLAYLSVLPKSVCLMTFTSFNPQIILLGFRYTTLVVILNILTGILFLSGDLTLTTLGQTPKVPFVSSTHSVTAVSRTVFDLHIHDTVKTDIGPTLIGLLFVDFTKLTPASKA